MNPKIITPLIIVALVAAAGWLLYQRGNKQLVGAVDRLGGLVKEVKISKEITKDSCVGSECLAVKDLKYPVDNLPLEVKGILNKVIVAKYEALVFYDQTMAKLGPVRPFIMAYRNEEQNIVLLESLYDKYGLVAPNNDFQNKALVQSSLASACQQAAGAERDLNNLIQKQYIPQVKNYPDVKDVLQAIVDNSVKYYVPAFRECSPGEQQSK